MGTPVGFIGLGNIGKPMAINLATAGFDLTVYDLRAEPMRELTALGAKAARSSDEVGSHGEAGYMRRLRCASGGRPRPSASSSELSRSFLLSMSPSTPPESPPTARTQFFVGRVRLRPSLCGLGTLNAPL